jgi:hypothetical protein
MSRPSNAYPALSSPDTVIYMCVCVCVYIYICHGRGGLWRYAVASGADIGVCGADIGECGADIGVCGAGMGVCELH